MACSDFASFYNKRNFFSTPITSPCLCNGACYFLTFDISPRITVSHVNKSFNRPQILKDLLLLEKPCLHWCSLCEQRRAVTSLNWIKWIRIMPGIREIMTQGQTEMQEGQSRVSETSIQWEKELHHCDGLCKPLYLKKGHKKPFCKNIQKAITP